jgi:hypothetical protein
MKARYNETGPGRLTRSGPMDAIFGVRLGIGYGRVRTQHGPVVGPARFPADPAA